MTDTTTKPLADILGEMFYANVRIEKAWPFPMTPGNDEIRDLFYDNEDTLPEEIKALYANWDESEKEDLFSGDSSFYDAYEELCASAFRRGLAGWIGVAATPVMNYYSPTSASFSWGHYYTRPVFGTSSDAMLEAAIKWADECSEKDKKGFTE